MTIFQEIKHHYTFGGMTQKLIFWCLGVFFISLLFFYRFSKGFFDYPDQLVLSANPSIFITNIWTLVTYQFLHASFLHLLFNLILLFFAGRLFTTFFTDMQLLTVYILSGCFAGLVFVLSFIFLGEDSNLVGSSGSIMGILFATTTYAPLMNVRLALLGSVKLWMITIVLLLLDLFQLPLHNTGGHLAHLAGALFGYIYIKSLQRGIDFSKPISSLYFFFQSFGKPKKKKSSTNLKKVYVTQNLKLTEATTTIEQKKIDEILDKISKSGYDSLTKEEKEFLFRINK